jgi:hypothetical protein
LEFLAKHPRAAAINFTFDIPSSPTQQEKGQAKLILSKAKMTNAQIKIHEAVIVAIAQWLTALCTPAVQTLGAKKLEVEISMRFICIHILAMPVYAQHLTSKFIVQAGKMELNAGQITELVKSCRGEDDELLVEID